MLAAQREYLGEDVFISHAGLQKDGFAVHLRRALQEGGDAAVFLDERSILLGQPSALRMEEACRGAKLVIFVVTREFLRSQWCMDELRWTLHQRDISGGRMPEMLTVLYPGDVVRGYTRVQLQSMASLNRRERVIDMLTAETIDVDQLDPLSHDLERLIARHSPPLLQMLEQPKQQEQPISLEQRKKDLAELASFCCLRADAYGRCAPLAHVNPTNSSCLHAYIRLSAWELCALRIIHQRERAGVGEVYTLAARHLIGANETIRHDCVRVV